MESLDQCGSAFRRPGVCSAPIPIAQRSLQATRQGQERRGDHTDFLNHLSAQLLLNVSLSLSGRSRAVTTWYARPRSDEQSAAPRDPRSTLVVDVKSDTIGIRHGLFYQKSRCGVLPHGQRSRSHQTLATRDGYNGPNNDFVHAEPSAKVTHDFLYP